VIANFVAPASGHGFACRGTIYRACVEADLQVGVFCFPPAEISRHVQAQCRRFRTAAGVSCPYGEKNAGLTRALGNPRNRQVRKAASSRRTPKGRTKRPATIEGKKAPGRFAEGPRHPGFIPPASAVSEQGTRRKSSWRKRCEISGSYNRAGLQEFPLRFLPTAFVYRASPNWRLRIFAARNLLRRAGRKRGFPAGKTLAIFVTAKKFVALDRGHYSHGALVAGLGALHTAETTHADRAGQGDLVG